MRSGPRYMAVMSGIASAVLCVAQSDNCGGATLVTCGGTYTGNTTAYTADVAPFCNTTDGTAGGVWYRFVGTGGPVVASLCGSTFDTKIRVYSGTCAAPVCVIGNDDFCGVQSQVTWTGAAGVTYRILVHGFGAAAGAYTLGITCPPPPVPLCYNQIPIPYLADPYAGTSVTLTDDMHSGVVNIGFNFCYNGTTYNQCVIASNNYITFNLANASTYSPWVTVPIPNGTPTQPHNAILDPWQDINPGVGGNIYYQTLGVAPFRRFVVSYLSVPMFSCTGLLYSSQIVIYESSNCIESLILSKPICPTWNSGNAVQGLQNNGGTSASVVTGRNNTQWAASAEGRFFSPTCAPCSTTYSSQCGSVVLPVELVHFDGQAFSGYNLLDWSTASEENSEAFIVERSSDGEHFEVVTQVPAAGNSGSMLQYAVQDPDPAPGANYYRLRSVDTDGASNLSNVIRVAEAHADVPQVFPNPATGRAVIKLPASLPLPTTIQLIDPLGRVVRSVTANASAVDLSLSGIATGTYAVQVHGSGPEGLLRLVVE